MGDKRWNDFTEHWRQQAESNEQLAAQFKEWTKRGPADQDIARNEHGQYDGWLGMTDEFDEPLRQRLLF